MIRIVILLSGRHGRGSNMQAIADSCASGAIDGAIVRVIGNYADSPALDRARAIGLATDVVKSPGQAADDAAEERYGDALLGVLADCRPDLIALAGYVRKLPTAVVRAFPGRIMNMHNALLPSFGGKGMYGARVHEAVIEYGVKFSGCTVHFVDENYDTGPIILQKVVPVEDGDDPAALAARVLDAEHRAFSEAIALFAEGRLTICGRKVIQAEDGRRSTSCDY